MWVIGIPQFVKPPAFVIKHSDNRAHLKMAYHWSHYPSSHYIVLPSVLHFPLFARAICAIIIKHLRLIEQESKAGLSSLGQGHRLFTSLDKTLCWHYPAASSRKVQKKAWEMLCDDMAGWARSSIFWIDLGIIKRYIFGVTLKQKLNPIERAYKVQCETRWLIGDNYRFIYSWNDNEKH